MKYLIHIIVIIMLSVSTGCARRSTFIQPTPVEADKYQNTSCEELETDIEETTDVLAKESKAQDDRANADTVLVTASVIFFPALIAMAATGTKADLIAQLKGDLVALKDEYHRRCEFVTAQ